MNDTDDLFPRWPAFDASEADAVLRVLHSGAWWRMAGSESRAFEKEFAAYQHASRAVAVSSGTAALEVALAALGIGRGDEVIVPAFTFMSTASAVLTVNAVPVFADVTPDTYCIDSEALESLITPRTRAVIPVHMAGTVADLDRIVPIARHREIAVIEDAAHAHGAEWKGARVGALGDAGMFSFQAGKLMTAGEGGVVTSNSDKLIDAALLHANVGRPVGDRLYMHTVIGINARMTEFQAAILRAQLARLDTQIAVREQNSPILDALLREIEGISPQSMDSRTTRNPHYMYMFTYDPQAFSGLSRDVFVDELNAEGVPAFAAFAAIPDTPAFMQRRFEPWWRLDDPKLPDYSDVSCPVSRHLARSGVWLHHRVLLADQDRLAFVAETIRRVRKRAARDPVLREAQHA